MPIFYGSAEAAIKQGSNSKNNKNQKNSSSGFQTLMSYFFALL